MLVVVLLKNGCNNKHQKEVEKYLQWDKVDFFLPYNLLDIQHYVVGPLLWLHQQQHASPSVGLTSGFPRHVNLVYNPLVHVYSPYFELQGADGMLIYHPPKNT